MSKFATTSRMMKLLVIAITLGSAAALSTYLDSAFAKYRLCAFRNGPSGPCTCVDEKAGPGVFKTVSKRLCRKHRPAQKEDEADTTAAKTEPGPEADASKNDTAQAVENAEGTTDDASDDSSDIKTGAISPAADASALKSPKLDEVRSRGTLKCGINPNLLGFSSRAATGQFIGMDADFCRAVAAATLGDPDKIEFVPLEANERFAALKSGKIDLLARNTTWNMDRDVALELDFAGALYFDGQSFMTSDERGLVSAQQLAGSTICVQQATTSETNLAYYFKTHKIDINVSAHSTHADLLKAYEAGTCDALSGDRSSLYADRAAFPDPEKHAVLPEVISKEPLGPAVLQGDPAWTEVVRWTLAGLINAEEVGLTRAVAAANDESIADVQRLIDGSGKSGARLGLSKTWLRDVVAAVGNYGEMFDANVGVDSPLGMERGINALWKRGGILYAPPMW